MRLGTAALESFCNVSATSPLIAIAQAREGRVVFACASERSFARKTTDDSEPIDEGGQHMYLIDTHRRDVHDGAFSHA